MSKGRAGGSVEASALRHYAAAALSGAIAAWLTSPHPDRSGA
ncbi:hypothetical protein [Thermoleophilum album]|jgi:hypothetical protein|nr:hypothetical protein [Thermoleophilum album]